MANDTNNLQTARGKLGLPFDFKNADQDSLLRQKSVGDELLKTEKDPEKRRKIYEATYGYFPGEVTADKRNAVQQFAENSPTVQKGLGFVRGALEVPGLEIQPDLSIHPYNFTRKRALDEREIGGPANPDQASTMGAGTVAGLLNPLKLLKLAKAGTAAKEVGAGARVLSALTKSKAAAQVPVELANDAKFGSTLVDAAKAHQAAQEAGEVSKHALIGEKSVEGMVNAAKTQNPSLFMQGPQAKPGFLSNAFSGMKAALSETPPTVLKGAVGSIAAPATSAYEAVANEDSAKKQAQVQDAVQNVSSNNAPVISTPPDDREPNVAPVGTQAPVQSQEEIIKNLMSQNKGLTPYDRGPDGFFDRLNKRVNPATYRKNKLNEEQQFLTNQILQSDHVDPQTKALLASHNQTREADLLNQSKEQDFGRNVRLEQQQAKGQLVRTQPWAFATKAISEATGIPEDQIKPEVLSKILGSKLGAYELLQKMMNGQQGVSAQEHPQNGQLPALDLTP